MTIALGLIVAAVLIGAFAPTYLRTTATPNLGPRLTLTGWVSAAVAMIAAALGAAVLLAIPDSRSVDGLIGMADSCVNLIRGGDVVVDHVARVATVAVIAGLAVRTVIVAVRRVRSHRRRRSAHASLLRTVCRPGDSVLWIRETTPVAYSLGGRDAAVIATDGVRRLGTSRCAAVLAHERAHLQGRHHLLVLAADVLAAALPFVPLARQAPDAVRVLVELAADATAARTHGPSAVREALETMSRQCAPATLDAGRPSLGMSRDAIDTRLAWLAQYRPALRGTAYAFGAALTAVPAVLAIAAVTALVTLYCLGMAR